MNTTQLLIVGGVTLSAFWVLSVICFFVFLIKDLLEDKDNNLM